jgi:hypothetical protein
VPPSPAACSGLAAQPRDATWTLSFGGRERKALVHGPSSYAPGAPAPLVLDIHGGMGGARLTHSHERQYHYVLQSLTLWREISHFGYEGHPFTAQMFVPGLGESIYRRSLYTFWKRTSPPPVLALFDAPTRETCAVVRGATNTPLQALVVMNEKQFVEAGIALGQRMINEGGPSATSRLSFGFSLTTGRDPKPEEMALLEKSLTRHLERYAKNDADAKALAGTPEQAAYAILGSTLINLDEFINRP